MLTIEQRVEIILRHTGLSRVEAYRQARIAEGREKDAAAARQQHNATVGMRLEDRMAQARAVQQSIVQTTHYQTQSGLDAASFALGMAAGSHHHAASDDKPRSCDTGSNYSSDSGSSFDGGGSCGGGDF